MKPGRNALAQDLGYKLNCFEENPYDSSKLLCLLNMFNILEALAIIRSAVRSCNQLFEIVLHVQADVAQMSAVFSQRNTTRWKPKSFRRLTVRAYVRIIPNWTLQQSLAISTERQVQQNASQRKL